MRRRLDRANFALSATRDHGKSRLHRRPFKIRIDFKVAEKLFGGGLLVFAVKRLQVGAGTQANVGDRSGELGSLVFAVWNGAGYRIDDNVLRPGIVLGAVGVLNVEYVAGELDKGVLESAAGSEERPV